MEPQVTIRPGTPSDARAVHDLVRELAVYERAENEVITTPDDYIRDAFGPQPVMGFWVAEKEGKVIGLALYYTRYSTWKGRMLYLEDLIVTEAHRGSGIGARLFGQMIRMAAEGGYQGMVWQVLDWNEPAISFYKKYQTEFSSEWLTGKLNRSQLEAFAAL